MGGMDGMMGGGFMMLLWILFWVAIIALVVWAVVRLFRGRTGGESPTERGDSAEETLRQRYARGEIDAGEYERSLQTLRGEGSTDENGGRR